MCICVGVRYGKRETGDLHEVLLEGEGKGALACDVHTPKAPAQGERLTNKLVRNKATLSVRYLATTHTEK